MKKKITQGGKRKGAGRKPLADKKDTLTLFIEQSKITAHGGKDLLKEKLYTVVNQIPNA